MGHQVNFFAAPLDIRQIESEIVQVETDVILNSRSMTAEPCIVPSFDIQVEEKPWLYFYLVRKSDLNDVVTRPVPAQGYWTVDILRSPVVEFNSCYFDGKILRRGRAYYVDGFFDEKGGWIRKPDIFLDWAKAVIKGTKKILKKHGPDYIGQIASSLVEGNHVKLVS